MAAIETAWLCGAYGRVGPWRSGTHALVRLHGPPPLPQASDRGGRRQSHAHTPRPSDGRVTT
jgi:hypothetical protein